MLFRAGGHRRRILLFLGSLLLACLASAPPLFAVDDSWTGGHDTVWGTKQNWSTGSAPTGTDNATFNGTFANEPTLGTTIATVGGIWMTTGIGQNVTIGGTAVLTLAGNTINGTAGLGILVDNANAFTLTINSPIALGATQTWTNSSANTLTIGAVNTSGFGLTVNGTGSTTVSGVVSGTGSITKSGTGTLTLGGTNTYTGVTTISAGTLSVSSLANGGSNSNIGASSNAATNLVLNGGTLQYTGATVSTDRLFSVGTSGGTIDASGSGAVNFTNTGSMGFNSQSGTRTLTLTGTNTGSNTFAAIIGDNGGATSLTKSGVGTWVLSGTNTYTGATSISAGILNIQNATALGTTASGTTISSGATLQLQNGITVGAEALTISGTGASGQNGALVNVSGTNNYGGLLTLGAATTISSDSGTLNLTNAGTITGATYGLTLTGSGSGSVSSIIGTTSGTVTKSGSGTWTLTGVNTFTGSTTINNGTLSAAATTGRALGSTSSISINSGGTLLLGASNQINTSATMILNGGTFNTGGLSEHGASNNTAGIGALTLSATSIIDMGSASSVIAFADSHLSSWTGTLRIYNWSGSQSGGGTDQLYFGSTSGGLTAGQLSEINIYSDNGTTLWGVARILADGEIVPVSEPGTWLAGALLLGALGYSQHNRLFRWQKIRSCLGRLQNNTERGVPEPSISGAGAFAPAAVIYNQCRPPSGVCSPSSL
ncbi:MAG TPA: autotransporter-associated beta strand repeat-containing protein [Chthoniobacterales bacterium]|jgi:fibronectin-binding autotransporter adhesin|nr:autotransporter-associated beta strand repeat-containing protein [Chthoniobacterales bacterium]